MNKIILLSSFMLAASAASAFTLVENGKAKPVVLSANAEESSKLAATEWTNYVAKATGVALEVKVKGEGEQWNGSPSVIIGTLATLGDVPKAIRAKLAEAKSYEASVTAEIDGNFWIVGKEEVAELNGTYKTLEDNLGIRWFKAWEPDDPGDFVPEAKGKGEGEAKVVLDGKLTLRAPFFMDRRLDMTGSAGSHIPYRGYEWAVRAGFQSAPLGGCDLESVKLLMGPDPRTIPGKKVSQKTCDYWRFFKPRNQIRTLAVGGGHTTFLDVARPKDLYATHPEYFALVDGKRWNGERHCLSNAELQDRVVRHILDIYGATGGRGMYRFGLMDGVANVCECDACRALDDEDARKGPLNADITTRYCTVVRDIMAKVYAGMPDLERVNYTAYSIYGHRGAPKGVTLDPRMGCAFAIHGRCYGHRLDDPNCPLNADRYKWLQGWMKAVTHGYVREYGNCSHNFYVAYERICAHDLKLYAKLGINGWMEEMCFVDSKPPSYFSKDPELVRRRSEMSPSNWQWLYVVSRLTWDPTLDVDAILDEIESKYYGVAYPAMRKYHALRRRLWEGAGPCLGYPRGDPRTPTVLNVEGAKEELLGYLDEAERQMEVKRKKEKGKSAELEILKVRVAKDRRWLNIFWIEPNEKLREKAGKALRAPVAAKPPVIDGRGDDPAWSGAHWTADFAKVRGDDHKAPPAPLATSAAILSDAENLYFLFRCKEPTPGRIVTKHGDNGEVYNDDSVELSLYPPADANTQFQVCVNAAGKVTCYEQPMCRKRTDLGVEAATHVGADFWSVEIKVPVKKMLALRRGDIWPVMMSRNRMVLDELTPERTGWSIDAGKINNPSSYRPMEIGEPYLGNGSFEHLDEKGVPVGWGPHGGDACSVVKAGSGHAVRLRDGAGIHQCLLGEIGQKKTPQKIAYSFKAKGKGKVFVSFFRYHDDADRKAPHGYRRDQRPTEASASFALSDETKTYSGDYTIRADEWVAIYFRCSPKGECELDDVTLRPVQ